MTINVVIKTNRVIRMIEVHGRVFKNIKIHRPIDSPV